PGPPRRGLLDAGKRSGSPPGLRASLQDQRNPDPQTPPEYALPAPPGRGPAPPGRGPRPPRPDPGRLALAPAEPGPARPAGRGPPPPDAVRGGLGRRPAGPGGAALCGRRHAARAALPSAPLSTPGGAEGQARRGGTLPPPVRLRLLPPGRGVLAAE